MSQTFFDVLKGFVDQYDESPGYLSPVCHRLLLQQSVSRFAHLNSIPVIQPKKARFSNVQCIHPSTSSATGACYRAFDSVVGTVVHLRTLSEPKIEEYEPILKLLRSLNCSQIPTVYDTCTGFYSPNEARSFFMVEQYIDGISINDILSAPDFGQQQRASLFWALLVSCVTALRAMHQHGLSGLDLSAKRVLVDQFGRFSFIGIQSLIPATSQSMVSDSSSLIDLLKQIAHGSEDHEITKYVTWISGPRGIITPPSLLQNPLAAPHVFDFIDQSWRLQDMVCPHLVNVSHSTELLAFAIRLGTLLMEARLSGCCDGILDALCYWDCPSIDDMMEKLKFLKTKIDQHSDERIILPVPNGVVSPSFRELGHIFDKVHANFLREYRSD